MDTPTTSKDDIIDSSDPLKTCKGDIENNHSVCGWEKSRIYESHHFDSEAWTVIDDRDNDIIIATAYKSGTTWMQAIIAQILFSGNPPAAIGELSHWIDSRFLSRERKARICNGQQHRRFLKTHLPTDAIHYQPSTKYIYVARDGRDAFMSFFNHYKMSSDELYKDLNESPGLVGEPLPRFDELFPTETTTTKDDEDSAVRKFFDKWLTEPWETLPWEEDGWPFWSLFTNFLSWWKVRSLPNVLLVHFNDLKSDLAGQIRCIAKFIGEENINDDQIQQYVRTCTFDAMKKNADQYAPRNGRPWNGGGTSFINKGTNGRWKGVLSNEQVASYENIAKQKLGDDAFKWLVEGGNLS